MLNIIKRCGHRGLWILGVALMAGCTPAGPRTLLKGQKLLEKGKYSDAVEKLQTATSLLRTNAQAWNYLGLAYHGAGQSSNAVFAYQQALALDRNLVEARYNLGCLHLEQNRFEAAKNELTTFTLRKGNSAAGFTKLGTAQLRSKEIANAKKSFSEALRLNPQSPEALNGMGLVLLQENRARDAAEYFKAALRQQPNYSPPTLNLAIISQQHLNDRAGSLKWYREYLKLEPDAANAVSVKEIVQQLDKEVDPPRTAPAPRTQTNVVRTTTNAVVVAKPEIKTTPSISKVEPKTNLPPPRPAVTNLETVKVPEPPNIKPATSEVIVETNSVSSPASSNLVVAVPEKRGFFSKLNPFRRQPNPATPIPVTTNVAVVQPTPVSLPKTNAPPPKTNGIALTLPKTNFARYPYRDSINIAAGNRESAERVFAQGAQAQQQNRLRDAIISFKSAAKTDPGFVKAHYALGMAALQAGDLSQALGAFETALTLEPDSADARYNFAFALKQANYFLDSANELEKLLAKHPNEARGHLLLANLCAERFNQSKRAKEHYLKVLEIDPKHPRAAEIRFWLAAHPG